MKFLSIVKGSTVQTRHVGKDIMSGLKNLVGGELKAYVEMIEHARAASNKENGGGGRKIRSRCSYQYKVFYMWYNAGSSGNSSIRHCC